ncbi:hypothetical protein [Halorussus marinus]|uniref:hypothetical protein n=1 Tax=Halorussus marinus TaxID=2505976 RepID=UPI00109219A5|nr:hypothetical protein [Halorussus marinus]
MTLAPFAAAASAADTVVVDFLGAVLIAVAASFFAFYAGLNRRLNRLESQDVFWGYLVFAGAAAAVYGVVGVAETIVRARLLTAFGHGALLLCTVFLAFSMREVYYNSALAPPSGESRVSLGSLRRIEAGFVAVVVVEWVAVALLDQVAIARFVKAGGSLAFATYGAVFAEKLESVTRGTPLDTLRRHLLPVVVCLGAIGVVDLGTAAGVPPVVVDGVRSVFVVLVAGFLTTATIRLQQNVEGLSTSE